VADAFAALRRDAGPEEEVLLDELAGVAARLSALSSGGDEGAEAQARRVQIEKLAEAQRRIEAEIGRRSVAFRAEEGRVRIEEIEAALPEGSALVEIVMRRPFTAQGAPGEHWGARRYAAYVLHRGGKIEYVDLGDGAAIDAAAFALRKALADPNLTKDPRPFARALDALVFAPIRARLGEVRRVFLSPDGPLALVPFGALVDEAGHFGVEQYLFTYLTSGRELLRLSVSAPPRGSALVVGDPAFGPLGSAPPPADPRLRSVLDGVGFIALPGTAREARAIEESLGEAEVLLGERATEAAVKSTHGPRVLHVATHGFFLNLSRGRAGVSAEENPLLRSGIALAGANRRKSGEEDGILTALEASALDLRGTRLVVLSACETGVGESAAWEGVFGLRRALVIAGAEAQVMSLWSVDAGSTRDLMIKYYGALAGGAGRSEGMRRAQLSMIAEGKTHPNLWAAFIVSGSWKTLDGKETGAALPAVRVAPGPRGCACRLADREDEGAPVGLLSILLASFAARRRFH
jgi:CHAT domain-containing protein